MTDYPIIFSGAMVRSLLAGTKTMTRRLLSPNNVRFFDGQGRSWRPSKDQIAESLVEALDFRKIDGDVWTWSGKAYPYQAPAERTTWFAHIAPATGAQLWVRESAWICPPRWTDTPVNPMGPSRQEVAYKADDRKGGIAEAAADYNLKLSPSIHMPRWASRLTLEVAAVKIERLQAITPADAIAEGIAPAANSQTIDCGTPNPVDAFRDLWNSLHGPRAWDENPVVVALTFTVHKTNIDQMKVAA